MKTTSWRRRLAPACIAWICACGGDGGTGPPQPPPDPPRPATVAVDPAATELSALGATAQLTAEVRDENGRAMVATVTWSSSNTAVATVNASGLVTAAGNGTATITASAGTVSGSATVTVAQQVSAVEISPDTAIVLPGTTLQLMAEAQDANGHAVAGSEYAWASSDTTVAVVDGTGLVTGIALGEVEVSATSSGETGRAQLEVVEPAPTTMAVTPDTATFEALGDTLRLVAEVRDQAERPLPGAVVMWAAGDTLVATVDSTGLVTAAGNGAAAITATYGAVSADATVEVMQVARSVTVTPAADTLILGDSLRLAAAAFDANGNPVAGAAFTWTSSEASIASVVTAGVARGVGEGTAEITAATATARGIARLTVFSPDRAPLVALFNATNGPGWLRNDNWLTDRPLAQWHGVRTDADGRVTWVDLVGQLDSRHNWIRHGLKGTIPPEVGRLGKLRGLWLYGNEISGTIPAELGDLSSLERLDLSDNELAGPIPPELGRVASLERLVLHSNSLEGPIPSALGSLGNLKLLSIRNNRLSGPIPPELGSLASLEELFLATNELTGPIPTELGRLSRLTRLWLNENRLSSPIPPELGNLGELRVLTLHRNELSGPIPPELGNLANLDLLSLSSNNLTGPIPTELGRLSRVTRLWLYENRLSGPIPPELGNLGELRDLALHRNELSGPIPPEFGRLTDLTSLTLQQNELTGPIPARLGELAALAHLRLEDNRLEGPVPAEFGALTALRELNLTNNAGMTGILPAGLTALTRLEVFLAGGTDLCVPSEADFETWLGGIFRRRIARCPEGSSSTAYLTQAVQSRAFPVSLVAGEEALLRVFVTAREATGAGIPPVRARFFVNDRETHVEDIPGRLSPIPTSVDESSLDRSANAVIPGRVIRPGLEMVIEVDPDGTLDPGLGVATRIPGTGRLDVDVREMPTLDLTLIPFIWSENPDSSIVDLVSEMASDPRNHELLYQARTLLPIAGLHVRAHEPVLFPTNIRFELLDATQAIRVMEGGTGHYMGMMAGNRGGVAFVPGRSSFASAFAHTVAHELGHNMSLLHAPCGDAPNPDPAFPQAEGSIGAWGYHFRERTLVEPSAPDIMGYCFSGHWIGDFSFSNALRFRLSDHDHPRLPDRAGQDRTLLLWGGIERSGRPFLEPAFVVDAPASLPEAAGDYSLTGSTAAGTELFRLSFPMPVVADGDGGSAFAFAVPVQSSWAGALARITLSGPAGSVVLNGETDHAVAIVRNLRSGQVRGILRGRSAEDRLQAAAMAVSGAGGAFEVLFSRGLPDAAAWPR